MARMARRANRNRALAILSIRYRVIQRITWRNKMKKIAAVLMVFAMAGCSSMGMGSSGGSGSGMSSSGGSSRPNMGMGMGARGPSVNQNPVIDPNGDLNIYHGG
jgi:hypothetical protein